MKIAIIQSSSLHEVILSTPIIRALNTQLDAEISYLTNKAFGSSLLQNPYLKEVHYIDSAKSIKKIKDKQFDVVIDLQSTRLSKYLKLKSNESFVYKDEKLKEWFFLNFKINKLSGDHLVDRYFDLLSPLRIQADSLGLDYFIPDKDEVERAWLPNTHQHGYAVVCISALSKTQQLPVNRLIELCDRINRPIILLGSENDQTIGEQVADFFKHGTDEQELEIEELNKKTVIFNACGKFNFNQQASIIKNANWIFSYENDLMHIAAAFKKKVYSIWGSSSPFFGKYPYRTQFVIFENNKLKCRPCNKTGFKECPKGHFKCMNNLTFDFYLPGD